MSKSLLERLPSIVAAFRRRAAQIHNQRKGRNRANLHTQELVIPSKDRGGFNFSSNGVEGALDKPSCLILDDNLLAMAALLVDHEDTTNLRGKIDLLYIDSPFNANAHYPTKTKLSSVAIDQKPTVLDENARLHRTSTTQQEGLL